MPAFGDPRFGVCLFCSEPLSRRTPTFINTMSPNYDTTQLRVAQDTPDVLYEVQTVTICFHGGRVFSVMNRRNRKMIGNIFKFVGKWKSSKT